MNSIFLTLLIASIFFITINSPECLILSMGNSAHNATSLCIKIVGICGIWLGIIKILERTGLNDKLSNLLSPVISFLFGDISKESKSYISLNMASNILGLSNIATPTGIKAIESLNVNGTITDKMIMLLVINATSLQLIPTTIISLRQELSSISPVSILLPTILTTLVSTLIGIILCKMFQKRYTTSLPI